MVSTVRRLSRMIGHLNGSKVLKNRQNLAVFIASQKARYLEAVKSSKGREWTVVMGNESAGDYSALYIRDAAHESTRLG